MKKILGLDLGTNSIGWALIEILKDGTKRIIKLGSRIVPMDGAEMSNFKRGLPQTKNATKREKKGARVGNKRYKQRRNKLVYVLQKLSMLPEQIKLSRQFTNPLKIQKVNILPIREETRQFTSKEFLELKAKAIHQPVSAKEFGRILYKFNQLRGYAGGDDEDMQDDLNEVLGIKSDKIHPAQENKVEMFKILEYKETKDKKKGKKVYSIKVENVEFHSCTTLVEAIKVGETLELKQTIRRNPKTGIISSIEFFIPKKTGWRKKMENLEEALEQHSKEKGRKTFLSEYFLDLLNDNKWQRIRDNVILRSRYEEEFDAIWETQFEAHIKNTSKETIEEIAQFLFPGTKVTQQKLQKEAIEKGLKHIIRNQIIYFQRKLEPQDHLISDCRFEKGEKAVAKSHPLFQEYKIWEQINKLSINRRMQIGIRKNGNPKYEYQVRNVSTKLKETIFEELQDKNEISYNSIYVKLKKFDNYNDENEFFNGLSKKGKLVGNKTKIVLKKRLGRFWDILELENIDNQIKLWDLLYNGKGNEYDINSDRNKKIAEYLKNENIKENDFDKIVIAISCIQFPRDYASTSLKVIEKALPLVRAGKYFNLEQFSKEANEKIIKLLNEFTDDPYKKSVQTYIEDNQNLVLADGGFINAYALMLLYGQHTAKEISEKEIINNFNDIKILKRNSLRNPLVEQMINETLMVVKDIWRQYGKPDEIKVELARELKNSAKERVKIHEANEKGRKINAGIRKRLSEMKQELSNGNIEKYKLWENQKNTNPDYIEKYESTKKEIVRLKLWEEQGNVDPYTGKPIQLSHLFNKGMYDIDHIIPKSRYFDDSLANKVVSSTKVNKDKGNRMAIEYFDAGSTKCELLPKKEFMDNAVKKFFGKKRKNMLATKIPDNPIERQKKETQYISVRIREELSKITGSKNVKTSTGGVTHYLRNHWGITDVFKNLLKNRFLNYFELKAKIEYDKISNDYTKQKLEYEKQLREATLNQIEKPNSIQPEEKFYFDYLNQLAKSKLSEKKYKVFFNELEEINQPFTQDTFENFHLKCNTYNQGNNLIIKGYSKRYDHRHHAMDALIVAVTDEKAVKRLNDLNKHLQDWLKDNINQFDLELNADDDDLLESFLQLEENIRKRVLSDIDKFRNVKIPWIGFQEDTKKALEDIIVSHKPKDKLLIQRKEEKNKKGILEKKNEKIIKIRGALHEDTIYSLSSGFETQRIPLTKFSGSKFDTAGNIQKITNKFLREIIEEHFVNTYNRKKSEAFGAEGLLVLNKRLAERTDDKGKLKPHPPISSIKVYRRKVVKDKKYEITLKKLDRKDSYNENLYVNTGSNYLFAVLEKNGKRIYDIISLFDATALLKDNFNNCINKNEFDKNIVFKEYFELNNKAELLFTLKQLDVVYFPSESEDVILDKKSPLYNEYWNSKERAKNIFTVKKFSVNKQIYFLPHTNANVIENKIELGSQNRLEFYEGRKIIKDCYPIVLDRLGQIVKVGEH